MTKQENPNVERIPISNKDVERYIMASFFAYNKGKDIIHLVARGSNIKKAVDVAAILIREYVENPTYEVIIGSEKFEDRFVSSIDIIIKGKRKDGKSQSISNKD